jgi:hypothetical protein
MPHKPSELILPPGTRPPKAIPKCPGCQEEFAEGQFIIHFVGAVVPGGLRTAPIHLGCAIELSRRAAQEAEVEAEVEEAKAWVHGDVGAEAEPGG